MSRGVKEATLTAPQLRVLIWALQNDRGRAYIGGIPSTSVEKLVGLGYLVEDWLQDDVKRAEQLAYVETCLAEALRYLGTDNAVPRDAGKDDLPARWSGLWKAYRELDSAKSALHGRQKRIYRLTEAGRAKAQEGQAT